MTNKSGTSPNESEFKAAALIDSNAVTLDPARALAHWSAGQRWQAVSVFLGIALMWLPFAGLYALARQFVPPALSIPLTVGFALLIAFAVLMNLTLIKRPIAFALSLLYSLLLIFGFTTFYVWLMNFGAGRSAQFVIGFLALAAAVGLAMLSNRILKMISLMDA